MGRYVGIVLLCAPAYDRDAIKAVVLKLSDVQDIDLMADGPNRAIVGWVRGSHLEALEVARAQAFTFSPTVFIAVHHDEMLHVEQLGNGRDDPMHVRERERAQKIARAHAGEWLASEKAEGRDPSPDRMRLVIDVGNEIATSISSDDTKGGGTT